MNVFMYIYKKETKNLMKKFVLEMYQFNNFKAMIFMYFS